MSHSLTANFVRVIFSTKERRDAIPADMQERLHGHIGGIVRNLDSIPIAIGGTANHVHILMIVPPTSRLSETVQKVKANSSRWLGEEGVGFEWQKGYGAFSVSPPMVDTVKAYIARQAEHHRKRDFDEEFVTLLRRSGVQFEEEKALG